MKAGVGKLRMKPRMPPKNAGIFRIHPFRPHEAQQIALSEVREIGVIGHGHRLVVGQQQGRSGCRQHRRQRRDEWHDLQPRDDERVESACEQPAAEPADKPREQAIGAEMRRNDARKRCNRANREVDAAGHDDEAHAERHQRKHRIVAQHRLHIVGAEEPIIAPGAEQREDDPARRRPPCLAKCGSASSCLLLPLQPDRQNDKRPP